MKKKANLEPNKRFKLPKELKPKITTTLGVSIRIIDKLTIEKYCHENHLELSDFIKNALNDKYPQFKQIFQYKRGK